MLASLNLDISPAKSHKRGSKGCLTMDLEIYQAIQDAQQQSRAAALALVVNTQGSIPRHTGAKMLIYADGRILGSVGGGTFESLVIQDALSCMQTGIAETRTYPLHEASDASFGAICGGEVMVYIEPVKPEPRLYIFGAGHCGLALAKMATQLS
jgi:xanthine dehydrogenase accessory factor